MVGIRSSSTTEQEIRQTLSTVSLGLGVGENLPGIFTLGEGTFTMPRG